MTSSKVCLYSGKKGSVSIVGQKTRLHGRSYPNCYGQLLILRVLFASYTKLIFWIDFSWACLIKLLLFNKTHHLCFCLSLRPQLSKWVRKHAFRCKSTKNDYHLWKSENDMEKHFSKSVHSVSLCVGAGISGHNIVLTRNQGLWSRLFTRNQAMKVHEIVANTLLFWKLQMSAI